MWMRALPAKLSKDHREAVAAQMAMLPYAERRAIEKKAQRHANTYLQVWIWWVAGVVFINILIAFVVLVAGALRKPIWLYTTVFAGILVGWAGQMTGDANHTRIKNAAIASNFPFLCTTCGYDLTGNSSGVCPECGVRKETMDN